MVRTALAITCLLMSGCTLLPRPDEPAKATEPPEILYQDSACEYGDVFYFYAVVDGDPQRVWVEVVNPAWATTYPVPIELYQVSVTEWEYYGPVTGTTCDSTLDFTWYST